MLLALLVLLPLLASSSLLPSTAHSLAPIYHDPALGSGHAHSSWQLSHAPQHAYELAVLSASGALLRTFSATSPLPRALLPAAELERLPPGHYSARVRARGPLATSPWGNFSAPTPLVLGLPRAALDGAAWLCTSDSIAAPAPNSNASWLRTDFVLPSARGAVTNASLFIVGLGQFQARLNGELLSQDTGAPGWTAWGKRVLYSAYAVSPSLLRLGAAPNALGALLGNSMYNVAQPIQGRYTKWVGGFGLRTLFAQLHVGFADGSVLVAVNSSAGSGWLGSDGGSITFTHQYAGEDQDAGLDTPGWDMPGFLPSASNPRVAWAPAQECAAHHPSPLGALFLSTFSAITVMESVPLAIDPPQPIPGAGGVLLLDLGKNFAGSLTLSLANVSAGTTVRVTPSETLLHGNIAQCSGGCPMWWSYTAAQNGTVTLTPTFSWTGFRWATVQLLPPPLPPLLTPPPLPQGGDGNGTVVVRAASYGLSCNSALVGDATAAVAAFCGASATSCAYQVCVCGDNTCAAGAPPCLPDPAQNCAKDFLVVYGCTGIPGSNYSAYLPAEADNMVARLSCPPPPPPPQPIMPAFLSAVGRFTRASVPSVGTWSSSNEWVNRIHAITVEAIAANLQSVLTDCPHRERLGWLEVSHLMFPSIALNFDIRSLWAKIALDTVDSQLEDGMVPDIAPEYTVFSGGFRDSPEWGSASVLNPYWLAATYADTATLALTFNTSARYVEYLLGKRDASSGLLSYGLGDWIPVVASPVAVTATATLVQDLRALAYAAQRLGLPPARAANYSALAEEVGAAFHAAFWQPTQGSYITQCAAGMALLLGITPPGAQAAARAALLADVRARGNVSTSGEIGNRYALMALGEMGADGVEAVWSSLLRTNAPGYGWMLTMGETALAESWTDAPGDSHIHAMYGHIDEFLYTYVAGIKGVGLVGAGAARAGATAWDAVELTPMLLPQLTWVNCTYQSPRGLIAVSYRAEEEGEGVVVAAQVPPGVQGVLVLPRSGRRVALLGGQALQVRD